MRSFCATRSTSALLVLACVFYFLTAARADDIHCGFATQRVQCGDLGCDKDLGICIPCRTTSDCYPGGMRCEESSGKCVVRSFGSIFGVGTFFAMVGAFFVCSVAVIAGVGGGGILVPMFCAFMSLPMQTAVGLSQSTICGQSTLNVYLAVQKKYPDPTWDRPLINYQYLSLLLPLGLIGTLVGGILSKVCPDIVRLILLFTLLSAVLYRTVQKMRKQYAADKEANRVVIESPTGPRAGAQTYDAAKKNNTGTEGADEKANVSAEGSASPTSDTEAAPPAKEPQPQYPTFELTMNFVCFFTLFGFNILRTVCSCGGALYWLCVFAPLLLLGMAFYYSRDRLRLLSESDPEKLTFTWNYNNSVLFPMAAVVAGAAAAMLGIGGGLVLGFVLYEIGLVPEEASVTGGMATFFIAFSAALQLLVTGSLAVDFGIIFFFVGMGSTALGQFVFMKYIKEHGLRYLIVGSLALVVGGSLVILGGYGIYQSVISSRNGGSVMGFGHLCTQK